ncbi:MAG: UDP-N-acetylmuramate dehydrogenase [Burkholderiales bacterium]|nr:UDP-N-acetylmuramate dehydrogenase [Burkholderiales bacterium]
MSTLLTDYALLAHNTFGIDARSRYAAVLEHAEDLPALLADPRVAGLPRLVLGGGSNVILTRDFDGLTVLTRIAGRSLVAQTPDAWLVQAGAGEVWHDFVAWTIDRGWGGLENLALIPGTVGAAPIQNIGAYGLELAERFAWCQAFDTVSGELVTLDRAACRFAYRDSLFKQAPAGRYIVVSVTFRLPRPWQPVTQYADVAQELALRHIAQPSPRDIFDAVIAIRRRKLPDPALTGNVGSFFKNPIVSADTRATLLTRHPGLVSYPQADGSYKLAAGWLIDQCGWKGCALGPVAVHERQALVLINRGGARGSDVLALAQAIMDDVRSRFGVRLEPEPVIL